MVKQIFLFLSISFYLIGCNLKNDKITITWNVTTSSSLNDSLYIVGNQDYLGLWQPNHTKMIRLDKKHWTFSHKESPQKLIEYKFTLGNWSFQAANKNGNARTNEEFITPKKDTVINIIIENFTSGKTPQFQGQITGNVEYHKNFHAKGLIDRDIIVWLPPSYKIQIHKKYPVLYMHDGQNIIDPQTASFGVDWQVDETTDSLIKENLLKEIIIVGSYCTKDRSEDYGNTEKGKLYRKSIAIELKHFIDSTYRTKPEKQNTLTAGSSMGGLVSFMLAWEYPNIYKGAICMSPAFKYEDFDYIDIIENDRKKDINIYIDNGGKQVDIILQKGVDKMTNSLKDKGYTEGQDLFIIIDKNAKHSESDWAKRFPFAIQCFFKKK